MSELPATYDDGMPTHFTVTPIDELAAKSNALTEALREIEILREQLEAQRLTWGASFSELDNELEGCREVSFKAQRELAEARKELDSEKKRGATAHSALAHAFTQLVEISLLTPLCGEVDDYEKVTEAVHTIVAERYLLLKNGAALYVARANAEMLGTAEAHAELMQAEESFFDMVKR